MDSTVSPALTSGITTERNAAISSSTDSRMTNATTIARRAEISPAVSMDAAVCPPIRAVTPVPEMARGTTVSLRYRTSAEVRASCGEVRGITVSTAAVRPGLYCAGPA